MLNFIIYEDETKFVEKYYFVIKKFIGNSNLAYRIIPISKYTREESIRIKNLDGNNIYILDIEVPGKSGLDLAREIRNNGDWKSQIIIVTSHEDLKNFDYQSSMLMLAFISKFYNLEGALYRTIRQAHKILTTNKTITFEKNSKIYNIPVGDILFFEKKEEEIYASIVTKDNVYLTDKTLKKWEEELKNDPRFIKTFRTYIVNSYNIRKIDFDKEELIFENNKKALLSRTYKPKIKDLKKIIEESEM